MPLKPIYDRLCELRAQLEKRALTHRWTLREKDLYNFSLSLQEIDKMRVDGKFVDSEGNKPEGQMVSSPFTVLRTLIVFCVQTQVPGGALRFCFTSCVGAMDSFIG